MDAAVEAAKGAGGAPHGAGSAKLARRIKLRLDDGSLIVDAALVGLGNNGAAAGGAGGGGGGVVHLPTTASNAGEKELERLQRLLAIPELPDANGFEPPPAKRPRLASQPSISLGPASDWVPKCKDVLQKLRESLGADAAWFEQAVDVLQAPDYYKIVHHPMWFAKIQAKLEGEEYATPNDFGEDMRQVWKNCFLYNPKVTIVHGIGLRGDRKFEELWANSGLSSERSKRATAGVAAPKFAPELEAAKPNQLKAEPGVSRKPGGGGGAAAGPGGASKKQPTPSGNRANGSRAYSHEVTSGGKTREKGLSAERRAQIANDLQNALGDGSLSEEQLNELMALLPPEAMTADESGETELDFESLDDVGLRKLDAWLRNVKGQAPQMSPSHVSHNPSVRLEANDLEDEDYVSD